MMKKLPLGLLLLWLCASLAISAAPELEILPGGVSPDRKLAIAIVRPQPAERPGNPDAFSIYLVRNPGKEIVRKIEWPADSRYATLPFYSQKNEVCTWSPDGRYVAIDKASVFFLASVSESRFAQVVLPDESTHPKGEILKVLRPAQSPQPSHGEFFGEWISPTSFVTCRYGLEVASSPADRAGEVSLSEWGLNNRITTGDLASGVIGEQNPRRDSMGATVAMGHSVGPSAGLDLTKYGFPRFDGRIEKVYELKDSQWVLTDIRPRHSSSLAILPGGVSPDGTLAIAVPPLAPLERLERADPAVYLVRYPSREIVQKILRLKDPMDPAERLRIGKNDLCSWSPDGRHVAIDKQLRFVVLRASETGLSQISLPDKSTHPKGENSAGLRPAGKDSAAVPVPRIDGERFKAWLSPTSFAAYEFGLKIPRNAADHGVWVSSWLSTPFTVRDLAGSSVSLAPSTGETATDQSTTSGEYLASDLAVKIEKVYELKDSQWVLTDLRIPAQKTNAPAE